MFFFFKKKTLNLTLSLIDNNKFNTVDPQNKSANIKLVL